MAQVKRKSDHSELMDGSGRLTKRQENQKALEVLARAKAINRPVRYAPASDNEFRRSLVESFKIDHPNPAKVIS